MKKKMYPKSIFMLSALFTMSCASVLLAESSTTPAINTGVKIEKSNASVTGYRVNFSYQNEEATNVQLTGGFGFYQKDDIHLFSSGFIVNNLQGYTSADGSYSDWTYQPGDWSPDANFCHYGDGSYTVDMEYDKTDHLWETSLDLPCASYLYQYLVSYDNGATYEAITDPENIPYVNTLGATQTRSQFYVPYDSEKQSANDDWTWLSPVDDNKNGTLQYYSYEGISYDGAMSDTEEALIYLPADYDADREEPYKVLYLVHGGGGEVGDWFSQGNANNIADHLMNDGSCEKYLIVTMGHTALDTGDGTFSRDYSHLLDNFKNYLIPFIENHFNVVKDSSGRALAGLSMGGRITSQFYMQDPELFSYYGIWSAAESFDFPENPDSRYTNPKIFLAAGFADPFLANGYPGFENSGYRENADQTIAGMADTLDSNNIPYNNGHGIYVVQGSHDWFTWPQVLHEFMENFLWK